MGVCVNVCVCVASPLSLLQPLLSGSYQLLSQTEDRGIILHTRGAVWPSIYLPVSLSAELLRSPECHRNKNQTDKKPMGGGCLHFNDELNGHISYAIEKLYFSSRTPAQQLQTIDYAEKSLDQEEAADLALCLQCRAETDSLLDSYGSGHNKVVSV